VPKPTKGSAHLSVTFPPSPGLYLHVLEDLLRPRALALIVRKSSAEIRYGRGGHTGCHGPIPAVHARPLGVSETMLALSAPSLAKIGVPSAAVASRWPFARVEPMATRWLGWRAPEMEATLSSCSVVRDACT
jgi:hypothetical protein